MERFLQIEQLESRDLLAFDPSALAQESLENINRMRMNPAGELGEIFTNLNPLQSWDADVQNAVDFFKVNSTTLQTQWQSLTPAPPLAWSDELSIAAGKHNQLMIDNDVQSHQVTGEADLGTRVAAEGYAYSNLAENIYAFGKSGFHTYAGFVVDWGTAPDGIQSPPLHREAIMDAVFQEVGISIIAESNTNTSVGPLVATQDFGRRFNYGNANVLGVVSSDTNSNGRYDAGEGWAGVTIEISGTSGTFTTASMTAGGYQTKVPDGTYTVTAFGGGIATQSVSNVVVAGDNVKIDFDASQLVQGHWQNPTNRWDVDDNGNVSFSDIAALASNIWVNGARTVPASKPASAPYYDVNGDDLISVSDVGNLAQYIITNRASRAEVRQAASASAVDGTNTAAIWIGEELESNPKSDRGAEHGESRLVAQLIPDVNVPTSLHSEKLSWAAQGLAEPGTNAPRLMCLDDLDVVLESITADLNSAFEMLPWIPRWID